MGREGPKVIGVGKEDKITFDLLKEDKGSFFYSRDLKEVFIMAMIYGFMNNKRKSIREKHQGGLFRVEYLTEREKSLIKAIAVKDTGNLDVLLDLRSVRSIAEEYAAGGISYLKDDVFSEKHGSYAKRFEEMLVDLYEEIGQKK